MTEQRQTLTASAAPSKIAVPCVAQRRLAPGTFKVPTKPATVRPR